MTRVKICGITRTEDGLAALEAGADLLGFVFYPPSHRYLAPEAAANIITQCQSQFPSGWSSVGVFVNLQVGEVNEIAASAGLDMVQLAGDEDATYCAAIDRPVIKVVRFSADGRPDGPVDPGAWNAERILLDSDRPGSFGGTGVSYDWTIARPYAAGALLAGGLTPSNAAEAIRMARPWGLDVSSGVERARRKDPELIREFLRRAKNGDTVG